MSDSSDDQLMQQYREGDILAFQELYRRHKSQLYRYVSWRTPQAQWVDEIVQDTWVNLLRARNRYHPNAAFHVYLYLLARNRLFEMLDQNQHLLPTAISKEKERSKEQPKDKDSEKNKGQGTDKSQARAKSGEGRDLAFVLADAMRSKAPRSLFERSTSPEYWSNAVHDLPSELGEVVILQKFIGLSLIDIAEIASVPLGTVRARLRDAVFILKWLVPDAPARKVLKPGEKEVNDVDDAALDAFLRGTDAITPHLHSIEQPEPSVQIETHILKRVNFALDQDSYASHPSATMPATASNVSDQKLWWMVGVPVALGVIAAFVFFALQPNDDSSPSANTGGAATKEPAPTTRAARETEMVAHTSKPAPEDNAAQYPKGQARVVTGQAVEGAAATSSSSSAAAGGTASAEKWLAVINDLLNAGLNYEANEEFAKFRAVNPNYPVPAAMLERLKAAKK